MDQAKTAQDCACKIHGCGGEFAEPIGDSDGLCLECFQAGCDPDDPAGCLSVDPPEETQDPDPGDVETDAEPCRCHEGLEAALTCPRHGRRMS